MLSICVCVYFVSVYAALALGYSMLSVCVRESVRPARKCNLFFISTFAAAFHAKSKQIQHGKYVAYFTECQQQLQQQEQQEQQQQQRQQ